MEVSFENPLVVSNDSMTITANLNLEVRIKLATACTVIQCSTGMTNFLFGQEA